MNATKTTKTTKRKSVRRKTDFPNVVELSKKINRQQNPGLLEDVGGVFTLLVSGPLISQKYRFPVLGKVAEAFAKHDYTKRLFHLGAYGNGIDIYFQYDDPDKGKPKHIFSDEDDDDFYWISVRNRVVTFQNRHGSVMTKRNTKTVKLDDGKTKTVLNGSPKLIYGKTKDGMKQLLEDVETTLENEHVIW